MSIQTPPFNSQAVHAAPDRDERAAPRPAPGAYASTNDQAGWRLSPGQRKALVALHIAVSVGLLGLSTAQLVLGTAAALTSDPATAQAAYRSMGIFTRGVVQPIAVLAIVTGVVLSLGTKWGLFQHVWIVVKLGLAVVTILTGMLFVGPNVQHAIAATSGSTGLTAPDLGSARLVLIAAPAANVLMLGAATFISVYKPWGRIGRGRAIPGPAAS